MRCPLRKTYVAVGALAGITALTVLLDATLGLPGGVLHGRLLAGDRSVVAQPTPRPEVAPQPATSVLPAATSSTPPDPAEVARRLTRILHVDAVGPGLGAVVVDAASGATLYSSKPGIPRPPASTVKILTATAALRQLGAESRLSTSVVEMPVSAQVDPGATPEIVLVGGGDPSLRQAPGDGDPSLRRLAALTGRALSTDGVDKVRLAFDDSLFRGPRVSPAWPESYVTTGVVGLVTALSVDDGRGADPSLNAARVFAAELRRAGIRVVGSLDRVEAGSDSVQLAQVRSQPIGVLLERMLTFSDNDYAEAIGHLVAVAAGQPATFAGAASATVAALDALGLPTAGVRLQDASGLSRTDRVPAQTIVRALALAASHGHPELVTVLTGLPVAGFSGTLEDRFTDGASARGAGFVRAKTGTLSGIAALAGMVLDADGHVLLFAFLVDRTSQGSALGVPEVLDRAAAALARCGCG